MSQFNDKNYYKANKTLKGNPECQHLVQVKYVGNVESENYQKPYRICGNKECGKFLGMMKCDCLQFKIECKDGGRPSLTCKSCATKPDGFWWTYQHTDDQWKKSQVGSSSNNNENQRPPEPKKRKLERTQPVMFPQNGGEGEGDGLSDHEREERQEFRRRIAHAMKVFPSDDFFLFMETVLDVLREENEIMIKKLSVVQ